MREYTGVVMKKVELLAPAGNFEALKGAVAAGADAVYLGGNAFGARAFAENFTKEEICAGIRFAHIFHKKIYLTVNTLVKEKEFDSLYDFLLPFYEEGVDGVIIQDLGVFRFIREHFPALELHVSTQMTLTGAGGIRLLKEAGADRVVPARELTLEEIKEIKKEVPVEIETFVHGAMCYCYSGQCLLSSMLGGRSGNRGRCAQPCRLPYRVNRGKEGYPLSMKDMCTLEILPELIEAGIDSFKIEGRMKKPEYAAGVTAVYRKYIDRYYENPKNYCVSAKDMDYLKALYIRSGIGEGYYHTYNGKEMITFSSPAYLGSDEKLLSDIRADYIEAKPMLPVEAEAVFRINEPAQLKLRCKEACVQVKGEMVQEARKQPLKEEKIREQLLKSGNTYFEITNLTLQKEEEVFLPVAGINSLRRNALLALEEKIIENNGLAYKERRVKPYDRKVRRKEGAETPHVSAANVSDKRKAVRFHVLVNSKEQLQAAFQAEAERIYIDRISVNDRLYKELSRYKEERKCELYLAFPYIVRRKDKEKIEKLWELLNTPVFDGALVRNLETLSYLKEKQTAKPITADGCLYIWNSRAYEFFKEQVKEMYLPAELNQHEIKELLEKCGRDAFSAMVYGRLPMMISANCLKKTTAGCRKEKGYAVLSDRYAKEFPVYTDCEYCYNIIYNSVPLSLHKIFEKKTAFISCFRLDFTLEGKEETEKIICYFQGIAENYQEPFYQEFTKGHYKRGVD